MARFLIEVPHETETLACARVVDVFLKTGSHWVTRADWGCRDGDHRAWLIVEVENKNEARQVIPPDFRTEAKITKLNYFTPEEIELILREHQSDSRLDAQI